MSDLDIELSNCSKELQDYIRGVQETLHSCQNQHNILIFEIKSLMCSVDKWRMNAEDLHNELHKLKH